MKLISARVTHFRSVEDSGTFSIEDLTCLVGKNEAGKSAILLALAAVNPHEVSPVNLDKERDYPRRLLTQYESAHGEAEAVAVTTRWQLESREIAALEAVVGPGGLTSHEVVVSRSYNKKPSVIVSIDFRSALEHLYSKFNLDASERLVLKSATTSSDLAGVLDKLSSPSDNHTRLKVHLDKLHSFTAAANDLIMSFLPHFMYFAAYDRMSGAIQIEQVKQLVAGGQLDLEKHSGEKLFTEFLEIAGVSMDEIMSVKTYETFNAKLQAASNNITDQVLEFWTQNPDLSVSVAIGQAHSEDAAPLNTGTIARARIQNNLHRVDTPFSERSAGFVWFFSFLVKFAKVRNEAKPVILLLDEPGLTLHGKAQADLLRFFRDKLLPSHQIIYSTHSPFMVPASNFASVRIVEDQVDVARSGRRTPLGTKVREDILSRDPDTLFPLQGALGYEISQSLFVGENTLLVEGPSDIIYLQACSHALKIRNRTGLDERWTVCPAGGIDKIRPFVSLFAGNRINIAVLSDQALGDKRKIEDMRRSDILKAANFRTFADFLGRSEADIEDLFDISLFVDILNGAYALKGAPKLTSKKLSEADTTTERLIKKAEAAFKVMPIEVAEFDHFAPASWLIENPQVLRTDSVPVLSTLERAESIFAHFNSLL